MGGGMIGRIGVCFLRGTFASTGDFPGVDVALHLSVVEKMRSVPKVPRITTGFSC